MNKLLAAACAATVALAAGCGGSSSPIDTTELTVETILAGYQSGSFTAEQVVDAYLRQIERHEPGYNAFTFMNENARQQAREIDERRARREPLGPLAGVPVVVKESMDMVGMPSTMGWSRTSSAAGGVDLFPTANATVVQRLAAAGAIVLGRGNIPAFSDDGTRANSSWAGPTFNAVDKRFVPGASSSGVATAVAAGMAPAGLAEETGGSIQNPAAAQSLVGVKPTFGLVPTDGVTPLGGSTRDVVGPIAATVRDAAIMLDAIAGPSSSDPKTAAAAGRIPAGGFAAQIGTARLGGKRIGLYGPGWRDLPLAAETQTLYQRSVAELVARGAVAVPDPFAGSGFAELALANEPYDFRGSESAARDLDAYLSRLTVGRGGPALGGLQGLKARAGASPFDPGAPLAWYVAALPELAASLAHPRLDVDLSGYEALRRQYVEKFNQVMDARQLDVLVFPHASEALPAMDGTGLIAETTVSAVNIGGFPLVTVPAGRYANGAPFSLVFVGRAWTEGQLLSLAHEYEQATRQRVRPALAR